MKNNLIKYLFRLIIFSTCLACSNSGSVKINEGVNNAEGFEPGFLLIVIIGAALVIVSTAAWIALALLLLFGLFILLSLGVLSVSVIAGLYKKSFSKAFQVFVLLVSAIAGGIGLSFICWLSVELFNFKNAGTIIGAGAIAGIVSGVIFGYIFCYVLRKVIIFLKDKFKLTTINLHTKADY